MSPRAFALGSLVSAALALVILVIPFVGVFTSAVLGPAGVALGAVGVSRTRDGGPNRKLALAGLTLGLVAVAVLVVFLATGTYSERAR
ncbi:MAG TPA: hypothetical protein VHJ78_03440 [Actinomycetota bacterium]|nr:hypothetical protein [Actinomycetota bacterium]